MDHQTQAQVLYTRRWRPEVDELLLDTALDYFWRRTPLPDATLDDAFLFKVGLSIWKAFRLGFTFEELQDRFRFLRDRFIAFKTMVETPNVYWHWDSNLIVANEFTVRDVVQRNRLSGAYSNHADPEIVKLRRLFQTDELKLQPFKVLFPRDPGPDGCSTNPVIISDDEWEYEPKGDGDRGSSDDGSPDSDAA